MDAAKQRVFSPAVFTDVTFASVTSQLAKGVMAD